LKILNILTVKWGDKYSSEYVNTLYDTISDCNFYCYTEDPTDLNPNINVIPIDNELEGVWNKLSMFQKGFGGIEGKIMYLDLDVVIQKDLTDLYESTEGFTMVECYWKPLTELYTSNHYSIKTDMNINSSVMIWNQDENTHIWDKFMEDPEWYMLKYLGIDRFIFWEKLTNNFFKELLIYSRLYGINAMNGWYNVWTRAYYHKEAYICLMNGNTSTQDYVELRNDINKHIDPYLYTIQI